MIRFKGAACGGILDVCCSEKDVLMSAAGKKKKKTTCVQLIERKLNMQLFLCFWYENTISTKNGYLMRIENSVQIRGFKCFEAKKKP